MVKIASKKADWSAIRADYVAGASYGILAERYHLSKSTIFKKSKHDRWEEHRQRTELAIDRRVVEQKAKAATGNVTLAEEIKHRLLLRLKRIEEKYPLDATEVRTKQGSSTAIFRIRDLTAAYKDLTGDMPKADATEDVLQHAREILGGVESVIN